MNNFRVTMAEHETSFASHLLQKPIFCFLVFWSAMFTNDCGEGEQRRCCSSHLSSKGYMCNMVNGKIIDGLVRKHTKKGRW